MDQIKSITLIIHIIAGSISLILFWLPVVTKKGGNLHRKIGKLYYLTMWIVVISSAILSSINAIFGSYIMASFLGYLSLLTAYPLWYSREILNQKKEWSDRYYVIRKVFTWALFAASIGMVGGAALLHFQNEGILLAFFGVLGLPSIKDAMMTKSKATAKESRMQMHISGTIISGIAAYTAFFAFGGSTYLSGYLPGAWQTIPWMLPTILGVTIIRIMKRKEKQRINLRQAL